VTFGEFCVNNGVDPGGDEEESLLVFLLAKRLFRCRKLLSGLLGLFH
jgi:hypothetical protein